MQPITNQTDLIGNEGEAFVLQRIENFMNICDVGQFLAVSYTVYSAPFSLGVIPNDV